MRLQVITRENFNSRIGLAGKEFLRILPDMEKAPSEKARYIILSCPVSTDNIKQSRCPGVLTMNGESTKGPAICGMTKKNEYCISFPIWSWTTGKNGSRK